MRNNQTESKMLIWLLIILGGLICLRSINTIFLYPLLLVSLAIIAFVPFKVCLPILCFLYPFAFIIKINPGQISFFTILFLTYVIRTLLKKDALKRIFLISLLFFAGYSFVFSGIGKFITIATMVCGFAMIHDACRSDEYDYFEVLYAFCFGIIVSSCIGLFKEELPIINTFIKDMTQKVGHEEYAKRFVGLNTNPNYYTMDISVALSCLTVKMSVSKPQKFHVVLYVVLSVFGFMSVSKSFLIIWVVFLLVHIYYGFHNGGTAFLKLLSVVAVTAVLVYFFARESVDTYIYRLTQDTGGELSDITTGRADIWITYIKEIIKNERVLFFGAGLGETLKRAPHNTYLEALYYMGIVGTVIYFFVLKMSLAFINFPKRFIYYVPILIMLIRFMGIGVLANDCLWYYLVIICLSLKHGDMIEKRAKTKG